MTRTTHRSVRGHTKSRPATVTHTLQTPTGVHRRPRQPPLRKRLAGVHAQCHQVTPVRHDANEQAWIVLRRHRASRQPHVAEVHVDSSVGEPLVKPMPIRAGLSKRWWTRTCVEKWRLFPVRKRTLQQGIYNIKSEYKELIHFKIHIFTIWLGYFPGIINIIQCQYHVSWCLAPTVTTVDTAISAHDCSREIYQSDNNSKFMIHTTGVTKTFYLDTK